MSLTDNGMVYTGGCTRLRTFEANRGGWATRTINFDSVTSADLRQNRTFWADVEEMAARPPNSSPLTTSTRCWRHFALLQPPPDHTGPLRGATPPRVHRHRKSPPC